MHYVIYALTLLVSSSMLFVVQPMVAKMVQPVLGGTPAVWNTAMVFFQALLLGGYLYAHVTTKLLGSRRQAIMHLVVLVIGLAFLPIAFETPSDPASLQYPALWLLTTLLIGVGWPFFVISTSAPLLQKWFSSIDHPRAADPYHLYAASNLGSVTALLAYPLLIEPRIGLTTQTSLWMVAYIILCLSVAVCAVILWKSPPRREESDSAAQAPLASAIPLNWKRRGRWILWAFIPSSMMLGVTTFITTDVAPMPLLWIPPLAIYICSFILVFARKIYIPIKVWLTLFPVFLIFLAMFYLTDIGVGMLAVGTILNFVGLFVFCMVFHGLLAKDRPHTDHLTEFYLLMSVGGVLGGIFNALIAPVIFDRLLEYPTLLLVAAVVFPLSTYRQKSVRLALALATFGAVGFMFWVFVSQSETTTSALVLTAYYTAFFVPVIAAIVRPDMSPGALGLFALLITVDGALPKADELHFERSFFAVHRVVENQHEGFHGIYHGNTLHGRQYFGGDDLHLKPASYYNSYGPLGQIFEEFQSRPERHPIGVVGLGAGAIATYTEPGQTMDFFEIDPAVEQIALNTDYFTYLHDCRGECPVILGDGRLQLQVADDERYELIVLDAYSSTAIPVHLLTLEAVEIYLEKLRPDGMLAFHISNRYLNLEPPLTKIAATLGLQSRYRSHSLDQDDESRPIYVGSSTWLVMARDLESLGTLADHSSWENPAPRDEFRVWTDDYANVLQIIRFLNDF